MTTHQKVWICLLIAVGMLSLGACTDQEKETTVNTQTTVQQESISTVEEVDRSPVELSLFVLSYEQPLGAKLGSGTTEDPVMQEIRKNTGVTLRLEENTWERERLNTRIASHELCDLTYVAAEKSFEDPEIFYPLDVLAQETNSNFFNHVTPMEELANVAEDGHVYTIKNQFAAEMIAPYVTESVSLLRHDYTATVMSVTGIDVPFRPVFYREDVLKQLEENAPSSIEELDKLLYKVKDRQAELGLDQIYAFSYFYYHPLAEYMGISQEMYWDEAQQKVVYPWRNEAWLDYFQLMRRWHKDGILSMDDERDYQQSRVDESTLVKSFMINPPLRGEYLSVNELLREMNMGGVYGADSPVYVPFDKLLTYEGEAQFTLTEYGNGEYGTYIARNSSHPDRALQLLTFLKSDEGDKLTRWGVEGVHYDRTEDGLLQYKEAWIEDSKADSMPAAWGAGSWALMGSAESEAVLRSSRELNTKDENLAKDFALEREACLAIEKGARHVYNPALSGARPEDGSDLIWQVRDMEMTFCEYAGRMIEAGSDEEMKTLWKDLQDKLTQMGMDDVEDAVTQRYAENLKRYQDEGYLKNYSLPNVK